jgi:PAS domain-containing protein
VCARDIQASPSDTPDLDGVLITHRLKERKVRSPHQAAEVEAIVGVLNQIAAEPAGAPGEICRRAMQLTNAGSAGISVVDVEQGTPRILWQSTAGVVGQDTFGVMHRHHSPCGVVLDNPVPHLMSRPDRAFPQIAAAPFPVEETLVVPFFQNGEAVGTLWVITHDLRTQFDAEDKRVLELLAALIAPALAAQTRDPRLPFAAIKLLVRDMPLIAWLADRHGTVRQMSQSWFTYTGLSADQHATDWQPAVALQDRDRVRNAFTDAAREHRPFEIPCRIRRADQTDRWHLLCGRPGLATDGTIAFWLGTATDFHDTDEQPGERLIFNV